MNPQEYLQTWTSSCGTSDQTFVPAFPTSADVPAPKLWLAMCRKSPAEMLLPYCVHSPVLSCGLILLFSSVWLLSLPHTRLRTLFFLRFIFKWKIITL